MEDKRNLVRDYMSKGLGLEDCLETVGISKSGYYYQRNYKMGGRQKTQKTKLHNETVDDKQVILEIKTLLSKPFIDYGYRKVTTYLKRKGYKIGKKKTYRLMEENNLLRTKRVMIKTFDKEVIKRKPIATKPLEIIEIDIKYVFINQECRNAYLITIFDIFHREAYNWTLNYNMTSKRLICLILEFIDQHLIPKKVDVSKLDLSFRTDNGSQFVSKVYRELMQKFKFKNVYIPPATPQLNGHIESFHSTVERLVCESHEFDNLEHARKIFTEFYNTYNNERYLTCLLDHAPRKFIKLWEQGLIEQREHKRKLKFFFKEEDKDFKTIELKTQSPTFEVNLNNHQDFICSQNKDNVNLLKQIYDF